MMDMVRVWNIFGVVVRFKCWLIGKGRANSVITDVFTEINYSCNYMQILHKYSVKRVCAQ